jgi:aryl-alcohol dehydrogenase-like predicted oxidoreductase
MPKLTEYKDMNPRAKAVVEDIAKRRNADPAQINNVWKALAKHPAVMAPPLVGTTANEHMR